jgi:hypothetical protein
MAKITRAAQQIFASNAGGSGVAEPGSTADGSTVYSTDPDILQSSAFIEGLAAMIIAGTKRLPVYEEINAVYYVLSRQLAYLFQDGIADWNAGTTYYQYSIVRKTGTYELYGSIINDNLNNALPAAATNANWTYLGSLTSIGSGITALTGDVTATGPGSVAATIANNAVTLAKLATQAANTVLTNATASTAVPTALSLSASNVLARSSSGNITAHSLAGLTAVSSVLSVGPGNLLQAPVITTVTAFTTAAGTIPYDDTIPQIGEGTQILSAAITPTRSDSNIRIQVDFSFDCGTTASALCDALFQDSTANAIMSAGSSNSNADRMQTISIDYTVAAGSTSARTYTVRIGAASGSSYTNGDENGRKYGGTMVTSIRVTELKT